MQAYFEKLPDSYGEDQNIMAMGNRERIFQLLISLGIGTLLVFALNHFFPIIFTLVGQDGKALPTSTFILKRGLVFLFALFLNLIIETLRSLVMKHFTGVKKGLTFDGGSVHVDESGYFNKMATGLILLMPYLMLTVLLVLFILLSPAPWRWVFFIMLILNVMFMVPDLFLQNKVKQQNPDSLFSLNRRPVQIYQFDPTLAKNKVQKTRRKHLKDRK